MTTTMGVNAPNPTTNPSRQYQGPATTNGTATGGGGSNTTPAAGVAMTTDANGNPVTQTDAVSILAQELVSWGFGQDAIAWATAQIQSNNSIDQVLYSLRNQPFYKNSLFGQVAATRAKAGLPAMTEQSILAYQDTAVGVAQQAGLPPGFINTAELVQLMGNDVSPAELDARITAGYTGAAKSDPNTLNYLYQNFGVTPGGLAAYWLNPTTALPLLQNQFTASQIGGAAVTSGYTANQPQLTASQTMSIAELGVTQQQAQTAFTKLASEQQLLQQLPGQGVPGIDQATQLGAEFGGNAADQQAIQRKAQEEEATMSGNYHFAETQGRGITGLGTVPRNG
jgi:hypothetical protein